MNNAVSDLAQHCSYFDYFQYNAKNGAWVGSKNPLQIDVLRVQLIVLKTKSGSLCTEINYKITSSIAEHCQNMIRALCITL